MERNDSERESGMNRRDLFLGCLVGVVAGVGLAMALRPATVPPPAPAAPTASAPAKPEPAPAERAPAYWRSALPSFAQQGEDIIVMTLFSRLGIKKPSYLDIGAHDPIIYNNTFLMYVNGGRGVLVEPNPALTDRLRRARPRDTVLQVGVALTAQKEADYYVFPEASQNNTFSLEDVRRVEKTLGDRSRHEVTQVALVNINDIIKEHFKGEAPEFLSIDVEGLDLDILKSLDFSRYRPKIICVETLVFGENRSDEKIFDLMKSNGYTVLGSTHVNTIFAGVPVPF